MTTPPVPTHSDHPGRSTPSAPSAPAPQTRAGSADDPAIDPAEEAATEQATEPSTATHDVRSGGHAGQAPRSLTEAEAHWQEHESSGEAWDSRESI